MGHAVKFPGCNAVFTAPEGRDDIYDLHLFRNRTANVMAFELTEDELAEINRTGRVFASVLSGPTFYPIAIGSERYVREVAINYGPVWPLTKDKS